MALADSVEAPGLNPRIGKVVLTVSPEQQDPTNRRDDAALMRGDEPQRLEVALPEYPDGLEGLGSSSEVDDFRVEVDHRLLVIRLPARGAAELLQATC